MYICLTKLKKMKESEKIYKQIDVVTKKGKKVSLVVCCNDGGIDEIEKLKKLDLKDY